MIQKAAPVFQLPFTLDLSPINYDVDRKKSMQEQFLEFHAKNPHVYQSLRTLAFDLKRKRRQGSIALLVETLRIIYLISTEDDNSNFKINNNYRAFYSRMLMKQEPRLHGFFRTRKQRCKGAGD